MASIAEILANPSFTPTQLIAQLYAKRGDANQVVADLASAGYKTTPGAVIRVAKMSGLIAKKTRVLKGRPAPKEFYTKKSKLLGGKYLVPAGPARAKAAAYRKTMVARVRPQFQQAASLDDLRALMAGSWKKPRRVAAPKRAPMDKQARFEAAKQRFVQKFESKYGMSPQMAGQIAASVGSRVTARRRKGIRSMVAMNPSFSNPTFDFRMPTLVRNLTNGLQTAGGTVIGVAASKGLNDYVVTPLMANVFKTQGGSGTNLIKRIATGVVAGGISSTLLRAFIPGDLGDKLADGAFAGGALYIFGGIEVGGKPIIPIGAMIYDSPEGKITVDERVAAYDIQENPNVNPQSVIDARVGDTMMDDMSAVSDYQDQDRGTYDF